MLPSLLLLSTFGVAYPQLAADAATDPWEIPEIGEPERVGRDEYAQRRAALAASMEDGVFIAFGSAEPEFDYLPYGQASRFRYLTGIEEPGAGLVMVKSGNAVEELIFVRPRNPEREVWEGGRLGVEGARALTGIPAMSSERLLEHLDSVVAEARMVYIITPPLPLGQDEVLSREQQMIRRIVPESAQTRVVSLSEPLQRLRAVKSPTELNKIRRAVYVSTLAHREAMRAVHPGMNEFEIQALIEYYFRRNGADRPAYASIVASGPNSTTLHYKRNDRFMGDGEVLLMDVGASYSGYAADISRTVPVNGRFSEDQRAIYEIVLAAQQAAEEMVAVGRSWGEVSGAADRVLAEGLARLGLIDAPEATMFCVNSQRANQCPQYWLYYMHSLGHGVGLDVHDPDISRFDSFQVGSAFTLEPGVYVRGDVLENMRDSPENRELRERLRPAATRYRDIGVRIEDLYILTEDGLERVSRGVPRDVEAIEALMAEGGIGQQNRRSEVVDWYRSTAPF